jgi:hypothetical protein
MQVRGPLAITQARSEPGPESFWLVTSIPITSADLRFPRPPSEDAALPCAPGKAAGWEVGAGVGSGGGVGMGGGGGGGGGAETGAEAGQFATAITGTVPADENATAQPEGVTTCSGTVTSTTPGVVEVVLVCASAGTA